MINDWIKSPVTLLLLAGIISILAAIFKGGITLGSLKIDKLSKIQSWLCGITGVLLVTIGLLFLTKDQKPVHTANTFVNIGDNAVGSDNNTSDVTIKTPIIKKIDIKGHLSDVFTNPLAGECVHLLHDSFKLSNNTDEKGFFYFSNLNDKISCNLAYKNVTKKIFINSENLDKYTLEFNPLESTDIVLCTSIDRINKKALGVFDGESPIIPIDSLPIDNATELHVISCFMKLFGSYAYAKENDIIIDFVWTGDEVNYSQNLDVAFSESGWRTWVTKKVWKGKWKLVIKTKTGYVIEKFIFEIV